MKDKIPYALLMQDLEQIRNDKWGNILGVSVEIRVNQIEYNGFEEDGTLKCRSEKDTEWKIANPYYVIIKGRRKNIYMNKKSKKMVELFNIASGCGKSLADALYDAIAVYYEQKGEHSHKNYAHTNYLKSVQRGYEGTFSEWEKDINLFNEDVKNMAHIIVKPIFENGIKIKDGVYKVYPKGINKHQDTNK